MTPDRSGDPNFPQGLRIQPSSLQRSASFGLKRIEQPQTAVNSTNRVIHATESASWDQDTAEDIHSYGIAGRIWEAAYLLACYLRPANELSRQLEFDPSCSLFDTRADQHLTIVELGSGAGYGSLHLARQLVQHAESSFNKSPQATLVLTDLENVVPLMERNVARAGYNQAIDTIHVSVHPLAWGNQEHANNLLAKLSTNQSSPGSTRTPANPLSHILCSDLVYFPELLPPLLRSIITLSGYGLTAQDAVSSSTTGPELIMSYKIRSLTKEQPFWSALGSWFDFQAVDCRSTTRKHTSHGTDDAGSDWHRFGSMGQDYGTTADSDQELFVFVAHRRKETIGCLAPESDADLMMGKRLRPTNGVTENRGQEGTLELEAPCSGQDYFEWLLLSSMGAALD
ncbi:uncharacterized protein MEPE_02973 [Melanopsichium pennsylvanicum]|uniref:Uncharacterized protein n=2 Tax=Melanopsichium pennsylvanicum TaxID=63383 RepID=A0AAJ4XLB1_9BASI|nr:conserved hypothetical protein [Melanopsichium pennsylvanicum 4]SNX84265.1 uncharacterized protein MEPE_02973 [Melanopsichium pennsylvanicum]